MNTTSATPVAPGELAIFGRLLRNGQGEMSARLARYVLTLGFSADDQARMRELAARNQEGTLTAEGKDELLSFVKAGHLLALLHSQARRSLKGRKVS